MLEFGGWLLFSLATMFVWTSIFFIMLYNAKLQREHEQLLRAETAAKDAQLQMLRYQLNPHFMFNTMNVISTLIFKQDNERANEMLDKLCEFFRYSLDQTDKTTTTLDKELELLELYISIEKVRFGNRLEVEIDIDDDALKGRVPYMLLQPIVENSIKHAIEPRKDGGCIVIQVRTNGNRLKLLITDQGKTPGTARRQGFGIGMSNTRARLDAMFGGDFQFSINDDQRGGTSVVIDIPLHRERDTYYRSAS
jgi:LytS/YehU family sensor histidine kinase